MNQSFLISRGIKLQGFTYLDRPEDAPLSLYASGYKISDDMHVVHADNPNRSITFPLVMITSVFGVHLMKPDIIDFHCGDHCFSANSYYPAARVTKKLPKTIDFSVQDTWYANGMWYTRHPKCGLLHGALKKSIWVDLGAEGGIVMMEPGITALKDYYVFSCGRKRKCLGRLADCFPE